MKPDSGQIPTDSASNETSIHGIREGGGRPLDSATRTFMESRFGHDFEQVRVHTDSRAVTAARSVSARAFTIGHDVAFASGEYAPSSYAGRWLLAHELAHVLQQSKRHAPDMLQRACGPSSFREVPAWCDLVSVPLPAERFLFNVNCDDFAPGEEARLRAFAHAVTPTAAVSVVGMASEEGGARFNEALSCSRAAHGEAVLVGEGVRPSRVVAVGPVRGTAYDPSARAVGIELEEPEFHLPKCGPDVTDWLVRQVATASTDADVLRIQAQLAVADTIARRYGTTVQEVAEGGAAAAVVAQETAMRSRAPARNPTITGQLGRGMAAGSTAALALAMHPADAASIGTLIGNAAMEWRRLVNHGARYDFKAHTMRCPTTASCPDPDCDCTVTFCPGSPLNMCFLNDLPGNLFYTAIGRFIGWSELTLQLGSQLAQLTGTGAWDPPEDTAAISLGFRLPIPLSAADICSILVPARMSVTFRTGCGNCAEPTTAAIR